MRYQIKAIKGEDMSAKVEKIHLLYIAVVIADSFFVLHQNELLKWVQSKIPDYNIKGFTKGRSKSVIAPQPCYLVKSNF